jgi:hypothetical protein
MPVSTTNLLQGPGTLYIGQFGAVEPTDVNTTPSTGWNDVGGTNGGIQFSTALTVDQLSVDQVLDIPGDVITARSSSLTTTLAEGTLANYARTWNVDDTAVTTGTSPAGPTFEPVSDVTAFKPIYRALILDGTAPGGYRRRIIVRRAIQTGSPAMSYAKADQLGFAVTWRSTYVSASIKPVKIIDAIV